MGYLARGTWVDEWYDTASSGGRFVRQDSRFRSWVRQGGDYPPEPGRYHLYVSWACPWASRTMIYRALKGLKDKISVTVVDPLMLSHGWVIASGADPINRAEFLWQVYAKADPNYVGRVTVPVLWDLRRETVVNNESGEIIRMFDEWPDAPGPLFRPPELASDIDVLTMLDRLERRLGERSFLLGEQITEADWRLFTTLIRFDAVYYGHFKCNRDRLMDFPELWDYTRTLYQVPGVAETVHFDHIKMHYYGSHRTINPTGIIPAGPRIDYTAPTRRAVPKLGGEAFA